MAKQKQQPEDNNVVSLKALTKSSVWDIQENDVIRMLDSGVKDSEIRENLRHYIDIIRNAFEIREVHEELKAPVKKAYNKQGYKLCELKMDEENAVVMAFRKKPIMRINDLSYENIRHISAAKLIEVLDRNFGGGWDSLSQTVQDIILSGFDISTTTLPKDRLHKKGGMYDKKVADGFEVLEVAKGNWVEAIFAKVKPLQEKLRFRTGDEEDLPIREDDEDDDEDFEVKDDYKNHDDDEPEVEDPNDDEITEENYSTMMDLGEEDPDDEAAALIDFVDE